MKLFISLVVCFLVQAFGGYFSRDAKSAWYLELQKPSFNPPGYVFAIVWPILYIMMAFSFWLIWSKKEASWSTYGIFFLQLALNMLWSPVFFSYKSPFLGLIVIILLWFAILGTIVAFYRVSVPAALLLVPYFLWVSFATVLNGAIWILNT